MATQNNVADRITRLIDAGRIYYAQPTERLRDILSIESSRWVTVYPGGERRPWGDGPNEGMVSMLTTAHYLLYQVDLSWEEIQVTLPADLETAKKIAASRHEMSPYHVPAREAIAYLDRCRYEGITPREDTRDIHRAVQAWRQLGCSLELAHEIDLVYGNPPHTALSVAMTWLGRRNHAIKDYDTVMPREEIDRIAGILDRLPARQHRVAVLAACKLGADAAEEMARTLTLREAEEVLAAAAALLPEGKRTCGSY